jgi:hypothetical protein
MKYSLILLSLLFFSFTTSLNQVDDRLGVKGPLKFNNINFNLVWSDKPNEKYYIQEYLPEGEKLESFNQMLTIHLFDTDITTKDAVQQKVKELAKRKNTDPICNFVLTESPDGKGFMIDFLLGESKGSEMTIVEFNVYRYKQVDLGANKKGILVYAFSKRSYGGSITSFFKTLKADRTEYLNQMISVEVPAVTVSGK